MSYEIKITRKAQKELAKIYSLKNEYNRKWED